MAETTKTITGASASGEEFIGGTEVTDVTVLDVTALASSGFDLLAEFGSLDETGRDAGVIFVSDGTYYEFANIDTYVVNGLASGSNEQIRIELASGANETIVVGSGYNIRIDMGEGTASSQDVVQFDAAAVEIQIADEGFVSYTLSDGASPTGAGTIRGADIIFGGDSEAGVILFQWSLDRPRITSWLGSLGMTRSRVVSVTMSSSVELELTSSAVALVVTLSLTWMPIS